MTSAKGISNLVMLQSSKKLNTITNIVLLDEFLENRNFLSVTSNYEVCVWIVLKHSWNNINQEIDSLTHRQTRNADDVYFVQRISQTWIW